MLESHKFRLDNGNEVTVSEIYQGEYAENAILLTLEEAEKDAMSLVLCKKDSWAIGRSLMHLGYVSMQERKDE